ncbi:MAG TPA: secretin N-terminal domain-containing protein, partial [Pirellulaceae bacterium]|nr:secretin N-terminal domain-containing protein [Pirellulaceae bacterium]
VGGGPPSGTKPSVAGSTPTTGETPKVETIVRSTIKPSADGKVRFNFRYAPWKDVLDWLAGTADLSLEMSAVPPGTLNYTDTRAYTPAEAIDLLNGLLQTKGFRLLQRERLLMLINLEDGIPPGWVSEVTPAELDGRGEFELVSCLFKLTKYAPEDAEADIKKLISTQGSLLVMPKAKQIYVTDTAGKLRTIRRIIEGVENPEAAGDDQLVVITLKHATTEEVLVPMRELMGMPVDRNSLPDASLRIAVDALAGRLIVTGKPEKLAKRQEVIKLLDISSDFESGIGAATPIETPQLEIYKITSTDSAAALQVLQTLLADLPNVRLALDPKTGNLIALATPSQHATISATLDQMQRDPTQLEVIQLHRLDTQLVLLTINKLFNIGEGGDPKAPKVEGDPTTRQLVIRGSAEQIAQIKSLLEKMGETEEAIAGAVAQQGGPVRLIPLTGTAAKRAIEQVEAVWGTMHTNRIRVVTPSATDNTRPRTSTTVPTDPIDAFIDEYAPPTGFTPKPAPPLKTPETAIPKKPAESKSTWTGPRRFSLASYRQAPAAEQATDEAAPAKPAEAAEEPEKKPSKPGAEIIVTLGPGGIVIASEDLEALDAFETLLRSLADRMPTNGGQDFTVFYLKYAKAEIAAALLSEMIGASGGSADAGGGGGGLMGNLMGAALGDAGGGLLGGLLGLDGGGGGGSTGAPAITTTGKVSVIPDPRLNALVVQAGPADLDLVEQLLKVIDQENGPEPVQTQPLPRMIPVLHATADEVAIQVKEIYAARMGAAAGGQQRQPSPEDFVRALRGGGGRGGAGGQQKQRGEEQKMTISVDKRSNSLIVSAPDPLFQEVKALVAQIDLAGSDTGEVSRVITLKKANPETVQRALASVVGANAKTNITTQAGGTQGQTSGRPQGGTTRGGQQGRGGQQTPAAGGFGGGQQNFFQQLQQMQQQGGQRGGQRGGQTGGRGGR